MTSDDSKDHYLGVMLEDMSDQISYILEIVEPLASLPQTVFNLEQTLGDVDDKLDATIHAVQHLSSEVSVLGERIDTVSQDVQHHSRVIAKLLPA